MHTLQNVKYSEREKLTNMSSTCLNMVSFIDPWQQRYKKGPRYKEEAWRQNKDCTGGAKSGTQRRGSTINLEGMNGGQPPEFMQG